MPPFLAPQRGSGEFLTTELGEVRRLGLLACRFLNEPWSRVLRLPFDEVVRSVFEGQQIEDADGVGAQVKALEALTAALIGGSDG